MPIVLTHDIDHLGIKDHCRDLVIPKFVILNLIALSKRTMSFREFGICLREVVGSVAIPRYDTWSRLDEWMRMEARYGIRSTWFVACLRGRGIGYTVERAQPVVRRLLDEGHRVGLHSQHAADTARLLGELDMFRAAFGIEGRIPLRMHYLAQDGSSLAAYRDIFSYDSSTYSEDRFARDGDFDRPINIMDTFLCSPVAQNLNLPKAKAKTIQILKKAEVEGGDVMIDLHQRSLSPSLPRYREYILWLYRHISELGADQG